MYKLRVFLSLLLLMPVAESQELPPLEAYGALPEVSLMTISPSGNRVAFRQVNADQDVVVVVDIDSMKILAGVGVSEVKPRSLRFVDDNFVVVVASNTVNPMGSTRTFESSVAWLLDVSTGELRQLLRRAKDLYPAQTGLGSIVGRHPAGTSIYMPAFVGSVGSSPRFSLYEVDTASSRQRIVATGKTTTINWFVGTEGNPLVREDYDNNDDLHTIWAIDGVHSRLLYEKETTRRTIDLVGLTPDYAALVFAAREVESEAPSYYLMNVADGEVSGPVLGNSNKDVRRILRDVNQVVHGIEFDGFQPAYEFYDDKLTTWLATIQSALPTATLQLISWSADFNRVVVHVSGRLTSGAYLMFDQTQSEPKLLAYEYQGIKPEYVAQTIVDEYPARDGLIIPALITVRSDVLESGSAPLIVLPHGGPAAHDRLEFDWLAQYFASRKYLVLQPQFWGSTGFGATFREAGNGEWGRKMQTDLDDGVAYLVEQGLVDPDRVCMVGSSYGGYAALAAGAFSAQSYKCHVSINGVSDIRRMLRQARRDRGKNHWVVEYWEEWYGAEFGDRAELDALSPALHADVFSGPVLLVHGRDDTVVPIDQSKRMYKALRRAGKDVEFVQLKGEDHWLSRADTRVQLLRVVADFIEQNL